MISVYVVLIWESWTCAFVKERMQVVLKMYLSHKIICPCLSRNKVTARVEKLFVCLWLKCTCLLGILPPIWKGRATLFPLTGSRTIMCSREKHVKESFHLGRWLRMFQVPAWDGLFHLLAGSRLAPAALVQLKLKQAPSMQKCFFLASPSKVPYYGFKRP